jgi:hypothetical protein
MVWQSKATNRTPRYMNNHYYPNAVNDLAKIFNFLNHNVNFVYIRFSDGETEILKNRYSKISKSGVIYRGRKWNSNFPKYDFKEFNPVYNQSLRKDLLKSFLHKDSLYLKGIPSSHNIAKLDRDFYLRLNGGLDRQITFSDLLMNSNYRKFLFLLKRYVAENPNKDIYVIGNFRSTPCGFLSTARLIPIEDNFFNNYNQTKENVIRAISLIKENSLILSSASSLSNVIGYYVAVNELPITFIDVGTALHKYLSLDNRSRKYTRNLLQKKIRW